MQLSPNKRIALNFIATYGRSLYALLLGLFSTRWVLAALGNSDFGLWGVVGSIVIVIGFLNGILGNSVGRYYAYAIGEIDYLDKAVARENLVRWFNAAVSIHFILPLVLCTIGYPIGIYAIRHWLVIPECRKLACEHVFILSLIAAFVTMSGTPYVAMYRARQLIAELSIWGIIQTTILFCYAYYLMSYNGDRLVAYAFIMTAVPVFITLIQIYRARKKFGECRLYRRYLFNREFLLKIFSFSFWEFFATGGDIVRAQGTAFLINRSFGATTNAAWAVSAQVSGHTTALSSAMISSITPALTTAAGAHDYRRMVQLAFAASKFGAIFILMFAIPLILEMEYVLNLWLKTPPEYAAPLCRCMLIALVCHKLGWGHHMAVLADGRVKALLASNGAISAATIFLVFGFIKAGWGPASVGIAFILSYMSLTISRVYYSRKLCNMSVRYWLSRIVMPIVFLCAVVVATGLGVRKVLEPSFIRLCATTITTTVMFCCMIWLCVLTNTEKEKCRGKVLGMLKLG